MRDRGAVRGGLVVLGLVSGCYRYDPLTTPRPAPGTFVAVTLSDTGSAQLARVLGPAVFIVRGRVLASDDGGLGGLGGLLVSVSSVETKQGVPVAWQGESVAVPDGAIASLDERRLAKGRSVLIAAIGAGGLVATTLTFSLLGGGSQPNPGGGGHGKQ